MLVKFRDINPFDIWIWLKFVTVPSNAEKQYIEETFDSWFFLGKLGGFNGENLQVQEAGIDFNFMEYDQDRYSNSLMSVMHNIGDVEYGGLWARCWFDLGTSDAFALDVLINAFGQLSEEIVAIEELIIGGENANWPIEDDQDENI